MNYHQAYYNNPEKYRNSTPGKSVTMLIKSRYAPTDKQIELHKQLVAFLKAKGEDPFVFERPRNKDDYHRKINAMCTILRKKGWLDEYFGDEVSAT